MTSAQAQLDALASERQATISVWMGDVRGGGWLDHDADVVHPAASTLKLPLVVAVQRAVDRGEVRLEERLSVHAEFASAVAGASYETTEDYDNDPQVWAALGQAVAIGWLVERAIVMSSNLATNLLIERVGLEAVNAVYREVGATRSVLRRGIQDAPAGEAGLRNVATAADLAAVLVGALGSGLLSSSSSRAVEDVLARCETNDAIPCGLPVGTYVAHKTGWIDGACHDVALVRPRGEEPFILSVFTEADLDDPSIHAMVADVARICWSHRPSH